MKKLLLLGGLSYLKPIIEVAHKLGIYVITCDYLPDNVAHKYSDEYCNVSIVDKDAVLNMAREHKIDGIMSFACDPGVVTAAYVAEKMNLPFQASYKSAQILQDKGKFREYLRNNGFNSPNSKRYFDKKEPLDDIGYFNWPVIVKPVDSAGSKGISKVDNPNNLDLAIDFAVNSSINGSFIIEDFIEFDGFHSSTDAFVVDGKLEFMTYSDHLFDKKAANPYTPVGIIWPSTMKECNQKYLTSELQRLVNLLNLKTGIYNIETCVGTDGKPYIMEVSPRGGGCKMAEIQDMAYNENLVENEIRKSVGMPLKNISHNICDGYWCEMVIHADVKESKIFKDIYIDPEIKNNFVKLVDVSVTQGEIVHPFTGANMALGNIFLRADTRQELENIVETSDKWLNIIYDNR